MKRKIRLPQLTKPNMIILISALALAATELGICKIQLPQAVAGLLDSAEPFCTHSACDSDVNTLDFEVLLDPNSSKVIRDTRNGTIFIVGANGVVPDDSAS